MNVVEVEGLSEFLEFMKNTGSSLDIGKDGRFLDDITHSVWVGWKAGRYAMYRQVTLKMTKG